MHERYRLAPAAAKVQSVGALRAPITRHRKSLMPSGIGSLDADTMLAISLTGRNFPSRKTRGSGSPRFQSLKAKIAVQIASTRFSVIGYSATISALRDRVVIDHSFSRSG